MTATRLAVKVCAYLIGAVNDALALPIIVVIYVARAIVRACRDWWSDVGFVRRALDVDELPRREGGR